MSIFSIAECRITAKCLWMSEQVAADFSSFMKTFSKCKLRFGLVALRSFKIFSHKSLTAFRCTCTIKINIAIKIT